VKWGKQFHPLDTEIHDRKSFYCSKSELNHFLQRDARRCQDAQISRTQILPSLEKLPNDKFGICAFYTISPTSMSSSDELPNQLIEKIPRYPIPLFLIAQLAVHEKCKSNGLGGVTLLRALEYLLKASQTMPARAVIVDCLDQSASAFYRHYGFTDLCEHNGRERLYLPMETIIKQFEV
jgi:predicted GNAT family N-acyltransferase